MRRVLVILLMLFTAAPGFAQEPLPPSLESLRLLIQQIHADVTTRPHQIHAEDVQQRYAIALDLHKKLDLAAVERQEMTIALARLEMQIKELDQKANVLQQIGHLLVKPETLTAIITAVATAITMIKVK